MFPDVLTMTTCNLVAIGADIERVERVVREKTQRGMYNSGSGDVLTNLRFICSKYRDNFRHVRSFLC